MGGTLEYFAGAFGVGRSLNPYLVVDGAGDTNQTAEVAGRAYLGGVLFFDADSGGLKPDLVTVLPSVDNGGLVLNEDGTLTVRYEIDPEAVWSDGVAVSGDDFAFTYEVVTDTIARLEAAAADDATDEEFFEGCGRQAIGVFGAEVWPGIDPDSISAGAKSFEYTLIDPGAYNTGLFRWVVPRHAVEGTDFLKDWHDQAWPSPGPFVVDSWDVESRELTVVRNDNYWRIDPETGQQLPYLDGLVFTGFEEEFRKRYPDLRQLHRAFMDCRDLEVALDRIGAEPGSSEADALVGRGIAAVEEFDSLLFVDGVTIDLLVGGTTTEGVTELEAQGVEFTSIRSSFWEHIAFHYGDARLRANEDSLVEHVDFRRAIAHGLDRRRIAEEASGFPVEPIDSLVEVFSPTLAGLGWDRYDYNPDKARQLLGDLCQRLDRDCAADPLRLVFTHVDSPERNRIGELVVEMLGEVGIEVDIVEQDLFDMTDFESCSGWESSTWTWLGSSFGAFDALPRIFVVFDPSVSANPVAEGEDFEGAGANVYAWGTDAVTDAVDLDDPDTDACDETTVYNQGPSSVRDQFTQRVDDLLRQTEAVVDPAGYAPLVLEMEEILADQAVIIPLYVRPFALAFRADLVGGYRYQFVFGSSSPLWNVAEWYLIDG